MEGGEKTKAQITADRRAKQEAQRKAKEAKKNQKSDQKKANTGETSNKSKGNEKQNDTKGEKSKQSQADSGKLTEQLKKLDLQSKVVETGIKSSPSKSIHPSFHNLALECSQRILMGSDAQCVALIAAFKKFISDYSVPSDKVLSRELEVALRPQLSYISENSPLPAALGNLVKMLKHQINDLKIENQNEDQCKQELMEWLDYQLEKMQLAHRAISLYAIEKLKRNPVVLVFSWDAVVHHILSDLSEKSADFRVIVLDSLPHKHGLLMLRSLIKKGVQCTYALINSAAYLIQECSHVLLGAEALLANGSICGQAGMGQIALLAKEHNVPVLVACPTYKFTEKVQLSSDRSSASTILSQEHYEVVPSEFISGVITELRLLPPSSAPAVFRVKLTA